MNPENKEKEEKRIRSEKLQGWVAIVAGSVLFIFLLPLNKLFFGKFIFEDTFEKQLAHIALIVIGGLLLKQADLRKKLIEKSKDSSL